MMMWKHDQFLDNTNASSVAGRHWNQKLAAIIIISLLLLTLLSGGTNCGNGIHVAAASTSNQVSFGVNYGKIANNLPPPADVVTLIQSLSIRKSKLYDADPTVLRTFGNTGISFIVGIANEDLPRLTNAALAMAWVQENIAAHMPATKITGIVVGNEIFSGTDKDLMSYVLPAMQNVYGALKMLGLQDKVVVSTAHSFSTVATSYPPSAGEFDPTIAHLYMKPVLEFLSQTHAPFLINVYPFFAYKDNPTSVSLSYVLFEDNPGVYDENTGLRYYNMFDAQMDAVYSAIAALGYDNISLLVSETGWPSAGDADEPGATVANAQKYHANLVRHVTSTRGTPLRPETSLEVYLFALFNEDMKPGPTSERNYGLFRPDGTRVYDFQFYGSKPSVTHSISYNSASSAASCSLYSTLCILAFCFLFDFFGFPIDDDDGNVLSVRN